MSGMNIEITGLIALAFLILVYVSVQSMALKAVAGNSWTVGARDNPVAENPLAGRAKRATSNLLETALVYVCLAVATELSGRSTALTEWGAIVYLVGRTVYLPAYLSGVPWLRTIIWNISTAALAVMLYGVLFPLKSVAT